MHLLAYYEHQRQLRLILINFDPYFNFEPQDFRGKVFSLKHSLFSFLLNEIIVYFS